MLSMPQPPGLICTLVAPRQPAAPPAEWFALADSWPHTGETPHERKETEILPMPRNCNLHSASTPEPSRWQVQLRAMAGDRQRQAVEEAIKNARTPARPAIRCHTPVVSNLRASSLPLDMPRPRPCPENRCIDALPIVTPEGIDPISFKQWAFEVTKALRTLEGNLDSIKYRLDHVEHQSPAPTQYHNAFVKTNTVKRDLFADGGEGYWTPAMTLSSLVSKSKDTDSVTKPHHEPVSGDEVSEGPSPMLKTFDNAAQRRWLNTQIVTPRHRRGREDGNPTKSVEPSVEIDANVLDAKLRSLRVDLSQPKCNDILSQTIQTPSREDRFRSTALKTPRHGGPRTPRSQKLHGAEDIWCEVARASSDRISWSGFESLPLSPARRSVTPDKTPRQEGFEECMDDEDQTATSISGQPWRARFPSAPKRPKQPDLPVPPSPRDDTDSVPRGDTDSAPSLGDATPNGGAGLAESATMPVELMAQEASRSRCATIAKSLADAAAGAARQNLVAAAALAATAEMSTTQHQEASRNRFAAIMKSLAEAAAGAARQNPVAAAALATAILEMSAEQHQEDPEDQRFCTTNVGDAYPVSTKQQRSHGRTSI